MRNIFGITIAAALSLAPTQAANLLLNAGFENTAVASGGSAQLAAGNSTSLPSWLVTGATCGSNCVVVLSTA